MRKSCHDLVYLFMWNYGLVIGRSHTVRVRVADKLCDPLVTHGPYLSVLEIHVGHYKALYKFTFFTLLCK